MRRYARAVGPVRVCHDPVSACLYLASRYCIETAERIELVFGTDDRDYGYLRLSHAVLEKGDSGICKKRCPRHCLSMQLCATMDETQCNAMRRAGSSALQ